MTEVNYGPLGDLLAGGLVLTASPGPPTAFFDGRTFGFLPTIDNSVAGTFVLALAADYHIAVKDRIVLLTPLASGNLATYLFVDETANDEGSVTVKTTNDAGAAANRPFYVAVLRRAVG